MKTLGIITLYTLAIIATPFRYSIGLTIKVFGSNSAKRFWKELLKP